MKANDAPAQSAHESSRKQKSFVRAAVGEIQKLSCRPVSETRPRIARIVFSDCSGSLSSIILFEATNLLASGLKTISGQRNATTDLGTDAAHKSAPRVHVPSFGFSGVYSRKRLGYRVGFVQTLMAQREQRSLVHYPKARESSNRQLATFGGFYA